MQRRVAAVVLPQAMVEMLSRDPQAPAVPLAAVYRPGRPPKRKGAPPLAPHARLTQVNHAGQVSGVHPGMTVAAARGVCPLLQVGVVFEFQLKQRLAALAENCLPFSPGIMLEEPDALLMELTGTAGLFGGEGAWVERMRGFVARLGHHARVAVAGGPRQALALARHGPRPDLVVENVQARDLLLRLPVAALGLGPLNLQWLRDAGLKTVGDLARQPRAPLARRLGEEARCLRLLDVGVDLLADAAPLKAFVPPQRPMERVDLSDNPAQEEEVLLFWIKRALDPLAARLNARQLAVLHLSVTLGHQAAPHGQAVPDTRLQLPLRLPLWNVADLLGALKPLLARTELPAPVKTLWVEAREVMERPPVQASHLDVDTVEGNSPQVWKGQRPQPVDALPRLWAELQSELGEEHVGLLGPSASHRPEAATRLFAPGQALETQELKPPRPAPLDVWVNPTLHSPWYTDTGINRLPDTPLQEVRHAPPAPARTPHAPLRVLPVPQALPGWPQPGQPLGPGFKAVRDIQPAARLWGNWWEETCLRRDYQEVTLVDGAVAWVCLEPSTGNVLLHGWLD